MQVPNLKGVPRSFLIDQAGRQIGWETSAVAWDRPDILRFVAHTVKSNSSP